MEQEQHAAALAEATELDPIEVSDDSENDWNSKMLLPRKGPKQPSGDPSRVPYIAVSNNRPDFRRPSPTSRK